MKKLIYLSLFGLLFSLNLSANQELALGKLKKIPLNLDLLSFENGGNKSAIDAYSDGVGLYTVGLEDKKFSAMNELVFVYGEEAKKSGETLKEFVISNGSNEEQELANLLGTTISGTVIGAPCDDGVATTENDRYIDTNGTCQGTEIIVRNSVKCEGEEIGSEILVDGISYLIVDNDSIRTNLDRAETLCTSNVTDMSRLYQNGTIWLKDLSKWDTSNVIDMSFMFFNCYVAFSNQEGIDNWDVSNVRIMNSMFEMSYYYGGLKNWDVSNVLYMNKMFLSSVYFGSGLEKTDISNWNVNKVIEYENFLDSYNLENYNSLIPIKFR